MKLKKEKNLQFKNSNLIGNSGIDFCRLPKKNVQQSLAVLPGRMIFFF